LNVLFNSLNAHPKKLKDDNSMTTLLFEKYNELKKSKNFNLIIIIALVATSLIIISGYFLVSIGLSTWFEVAYSAVSLAIAMILLRRVFLK